MNPPRPASLLHRGLVVAALLAAAQAGSPASAVPAPTSAGSAAAPGYAEERTLITQERAAAEARFKSREDECQQRFIVTSCLDEAKVERRKAIDQLRARQLVIDEARRSERAQERRRQLAEKAAEDSRRGGTPTAHGAASAPVAPASGPVGPPQQKLANRKGNGRSTEERSRAHSSLPEIGVKPQALESKAAREENEASRRAAFEARKAEAAQHRQETIERTAKRTAHKAPAAPLPAPAASVAVRAPPP